MTKTYLIENLDCAHCGAKIERQLNMLDGIQNAALTFATMQLKITADDPDSLFDQVEKTAKKIEPDIKLTAREKSRSSSSHHTAHKHDEVCSCGHDHHHEHEDSCGCGHDHHHEHEDSCGCGHDHHHEHEDSCGCGHDHHHEHEDSCGCGHDHHHEHEDSCSCGHEHHRVSSPDPSGSTVTRIYTIENLACAHCGSKIEHLINEMPGVEEAVLTFPTKQLQITAGNPDSLFDEICKIAAKVEPNVRLIKKDKKSENASRSDISSRSSISDNTKNILTLSSGALLFIAGSILDHMGFASPSLLLFIISYIILGSSVLITAGKHLLSGQLFDENFLMTIATLGAFAIHQYPEAVGVMLFYRVGEFFEAKAVERSRSQIMETADMRPDTVTLVSGSTTKEINAQDADIDDIVLVRPGDRIPLDGTVVEGESRIDTSPVTGEPVPVKVSKGSSVISGCVNTSGLIKIKVEKVLEDSMVTRILDSIENAAASKPKIDRFITRFARVYTPIVIALALFTAIVPSIITKNWSYWIYTALSFLVISCPCALVLSVPLAYFSGIGAGSKLGILFKGGVSLEAMKDIDTVVMDKTGTITMGNFNVQKIVPSDPSITADELLSKCAQCESASTHPIANSIVTAAKEKGLQVSHPDQLEELSGLGTRAVINGHTYLCGNKKLMDRYDIDISDYDETSFGTEVLAARDGVFIGHMVISDTMKANSTSAIASLKRQGITPVMFTGDSKDSAMDIARRAGIDDVKYSLLPQDKLSALKDIRKNHKSVMFVGDGINDAPVLAGADVGAAMGSGADAAIEAADVVFMTSSMDALPQSIRIARKTNRTALENVVFALAVKILVMILGLAGFASMWMAVFADTGVAILCVLNSVRILYTHQK